MNQNQKPKGKEAGSLSKYERQKRQKLYMQDGASCWSVGYLVKASTLPVSKVGQFSTSKPMYTKFILVMGKFKRLKVFARFKNEIWCMDFAFVDKLAKDNNGVEYIKVCQDLVDGIADAEGIKPKNPKQRVRSFLTIKEKRTDPR